MWNKSKKIISLVAAATLLGATFAMTGCNKGLYKGEKLDYVSTREDVKSNGGFVVEKGDYVYFINGAEDFTVSNEFGKVTKGALMRIKKTDLDAGNYANVQTVVPMLFVAQDFDAGIYIYDDYVYYATPTTDKNLSGEVENTWIDFKRAPLDGSWAMEGYFFRLSNNAANYRFVQVEGKVYCLYEEDGALKSYSVEEETSRVLVKGAKSSFYFDKTDAENPNVYYTMSVVNGVDTDHSTTADYDQLYCVNAAAMIEGKADKNTASYTVKGGRTYDFDENFLKAKNKEAKENKEDEPYKLDDYTTYPYVNLGTLVLDGIGVNAITADKVTQFSDLKDETPGSPDGYNYTISGYQNGGVYFTRTEVTKTSSEGENTKLYYLADADVASEWNTIDGNKKENLDVVALNTTNASATAVYTVNNGVHEYFYVENGILYKAAQPNEKDEVVSFALAYNLSNATLWTIDGDYLYYYGTGTNGSNLSRINCKGNADDYNPLLVEEKYEPITLAYVDWNSASWYKPEIIGDTLIYNNAQSFGSISYNYIYATKIGATNDEIKANNEAYEEVNEFIDSYSSNSALQKLMKYYFRTGTTSAYEDVKELYDTYQVEKFEEFVKETTEGKYKLESAFISQLGVTKSEDAEAIAKSWVDSLLSEEVTEEKSGLPAWAIVLIVVGSLLVVAGAVCIPLFVINNNKKKAQQEEVDAIVNAHKKKIDTTDDKSIDVYADEEAPKAEEMTEEAPEEEAVEEVVSEEDATEEVAEEAPVAEEKIEE